MKKFLRNIIAFVLALLFISLFFLLSTIFVYKYRLNNFRLDNDVSIIICGDSHPQCAINDSIIKNSLNISYESQHYLYTYNVLKFVIEKNPQVNTVILGSSFHSFNEVHDKIIYEGDETTEFYSIFFPILDSESARLIISKNCSGFLKSINRIIIKMIKSILSLRNSYHNYPFIGHFYNSHKSNLNDTTVSTAIKRHYYHANGKEQGFSYYQNEYLNKIIKLCSSNTIRLILINTPISNRYYTRIPEKFISNYYSILSDLNKDVVFWDFHSMQMKEEYFGDGDHLNATGATVLTERIDSLLKIK